MGVRHKMVYIVPAPPVLIHVAFQADAAHVSVLPICDRRALRCEVHTRNKVRSTSRANLRNVAPAYVPHALVSNMTSKHLYI